MTQVTIEVNNIRSRVLGILDKKVLSRLDQTLSYELPGAFFMQSYNPWAGVKRLFSLQTQAFPTGLIHYVESVLREEDVEFEIVDNRIPVSLGEELPYFGPKLRDYQIETVNRAVQKQRGIIKVATGGGKTLIAAQLIAKINLPTLVLTHKVDLLYQMKKVFETALQIPIGIIGNGQFDIQQVTIATIQTVARVFETVKKQKRKKQDPDEEIVVTKAEQIKSLIESIPCLITDEVHHVAADSFWTVHKKANKAYFKWGFSASPWREDNAGLLIEAAHARQFIDVSASTLIERGFLVPPTVYLYMFKHPKKLREGSYAEIYDEEVMNNTQRNKVVVSCALKAASQNKTVLIAVTKIEHGKILETMLQQVEPDALFVYGESESELRQQVLQELNERKRRIVICTTIFGEGVDVPNLDVLINAKAADSSVDAFQLLGRVLRKTPEKTKAFVVDVYDQGCKYLERHSKNRVRIYKTEPKYDLKTVYSLPEVNFIA
jgi:superfamily II DNA or RNA helicase